MRPTVTRTLWGARAEVQPEAAGSNLVSEKLLQLIVVLGIATRNQLGASDLSFHDPHRPLADQRRAVHP